MDRVQAHDRRHSWAEAAGSDKGLELLKLFSSSTSCVLAEEERYSERAKRWEMPRFMGKKAPAD